MTTPTHHAPGSDRMRWACEHALEHHRRSDLAGVPTTLSVDPVPHFVPGLGASGEWYRVGALHQTTIDCHLSVYLDAVTGDILLEQPMQAVLSDAEYATAEGRGGLRLLPPGHDDHGRQVGAISPLASRARALIFALPNRRSSVEDDAP